MEGFIWNTEVDRLCILNDCTIETAHQKQCFVDSFVALCAAFGENRRQLFLWLERNKAASFVLYEELIDTLHPSVLQFIFQNAAVLSVVQANNGKDSRLLLQLHQIKSNGKMSDELFEISREQGTNEISLQKFHPSTAAEKKTATQPEAANPFDDLQFSVLLTDSQKQSKDALSLPHWSARKAAEDTEKETKPAVISYFHAKEDDFDEEDPDADLEF